MTNTTRDMRFSCILVGTFFYMYVCFFDNLECSECTKRIDGEQRQASGEMQRDSQLAVDVQILEAQDEHLTVHHKTSQDELKPRMEEC